MAAEWDTSKHLHRWGKDNQCGILREWEDTGIPAQIFLENECLGSGQDK